MLDHRILLISLLVSFLVLNAAPRFPHATAASPSRLTPIEVEPDAVVAPGERGEV